MFMETEYFYNEIGNCSEILHNGALVAVPTETVYGLACNGLDPDAVEKVYDVKGRPEKKPLSLMVHGVEDIDKYCINVPYEARILAETFWPGPLTIILESKDIVPSVVRAGGKTVGLRCPDSPLTLKLLKESDLPFAAPSANPSGKDSPKNAENVMKYFNGYIDAVIDGGECSLGFESTIIDMSSKPFRILRQGSLSREKISDVLKNNLCIIGITGGSGCGKTTALSALYDIGALVIDCDAVYHDMLNNDYKMLSELKENFPSSFINDILDRKILGSIVFADENKLLLLNRITHNLIIDRIESMLSDFALSGGRIAGIDAIELCSTAVGDMCRLKIAVCADEEVRIARIMERDGISREYAKKRIKAQHDDVYFKEHCDYVIYNNGSSEDLKKKILEIVKEVL